jgi:hypothetical protein
MKSDGTGFSSTPSRPSSGGTATTAWERPTANSGRVPESPKIVIERPYAKRRQARKPWGNLYRRRSEGVARPRTGADLWQRGISDVQLHWRRNAPTEINGRRGCQEPRRSTGTPHGCPRAPNHELDGGGPNLSHLAAKVDNSAERRF